MHGCLLKIHLISVYFWHRICSFRYIDSRFVDAQNLIVYKKSLSILYEWLIWIRPQLSWTRTQTENEFYIWESNYTDSD